MSTKDTEKKGIKAFKYYLERNFNGHAEIIEDLFSKQNEFGCDLIIELDDKKYFIEIKASERTLGTNIRFTHQTIAKMYKKNILDKMIVVYVFNLYKGEENAEFKFFKFGAVEHEHIFIEPHFIVQPKSKNKNYDIDAIKEDLKSAIESKLADNNIEDKFNSRVKEHMYLLKEEE